MTLTCDCGDKDFTVQFMDNDARMAGLRCSSCKKITAHSTDPENGDAPTPA